MTDPFDDRLREALHAEAGDAVVDESMLDRIRAPLARPTRARRRWLGAVAAAVALIAGASIALRDGGANGRTEVATGAPQPSTEQPAPSLLELRANGPVPQPCTRGPADLSVYMLPTATADEVAAIDQQLALDARINVFRYVDQSAAYGDFQRMFEDEPELLDAVGPEDLPTAFVVDVIDEEVRSALTDELSGRPGVSEVVSVVCGANQGPRPALIALVREDGWLVTVDLATGEQRDLFSAGDPRDEQGEGGPTFIDGVDLSPDGGWIYFSTCCEPASGTTFRVRVGGGEPERFGNGAHPRVSPDGRFVAVSEGEYLWILSTEQVDNQLGAGLYSELMLDGGASDITWSPDGTQIAVVLGRPFDASGARHGPGVVRLLDWDGAQLTEADLGKPSNPGSFAWFTPDSTLSISAGGPVDDDRWRSDDVSRTWILWVDEEGVVREQQGHESGDRTPIPGVPNALAADW